MTPVSDRAYRKLKSMIYRGSLGPGDRLVERTLARELGVSRIPLREGLVRLESEGLIRSIPNSATFVEDFAPPDVLEIYTMRLLLEPFASQRVATKPTRKLVSQLRQLCERMRDFEAAGDEAKLDDADYQFHFGIVRASGHGRLIRAYDGSNIRIMSLRASQIGRKREKAAADEHARLVDLIERSQPSAAERAARSHVQQALRSVERALQSGGRLSAS